MSLDSRLERWVVHHRVHALDEAFVALTRIGSHGAIWLLIAIVAALCWRRPAIFIYVAVADLLADVSSALLREAIGASGRRFASRTRWFPSQARRASRPGMRRPASRARPRSPG